MREFIPRKVLDMLEVVIKEILVSISFGMALNLI